MTSSTIVLITTIVVIIVFLVQGFIYSSSRYDKVSYFLYGRSLTDNEYNYSFAAGSTSLATVLFFFVTFGVQHGIYILLAPLSYFGGGYIYNEKILPKLKYQGFFDDSKTSRREVSIGTTLARYIQDRYDSYSVKISVILVTIIGILSILLIELFVGVTIFETFLSETYRDVGVIVIAAVVFVYTTVGGLPAVVNTDKIQIWAMVVATISLIVFLIWRSYMLGAEFNWGLIFPEVPSLYEGILLPYPLLLNILVVNSLMIPSLLRTWQLTSSSREMDDVRSGLYYGIGLTVFLTLIFILIGIILFGVIDPSVDFSLLGIIRYLGIDGAISKYFVLPAFFAACLAALLSTADSALMPILQSLYQDIYDISNNNGEKKSFFMPVVGFSSVVLIVAMALYYVVFRILRFDLINWLFTIFSLVIVVAPPVIYGALRKGKELKETRYTVAALAAIWGGLLIAVTVSVLGNHLGMPWVVQLNSPLAAGFGFIWFSITSLFDATS